MWTRRTGDRPEDLHVRGDRVYFRLAGRRLAIRLPSDCDLLTMDPADAHGYIWMRYGTAIQALVPEARRPSTPR